MLMDLTTVFRSQRLWQNDGQGADQLALSVCNSVDHLFTTWVQWSSGIGVSVFLESPGILKLLISMLLEFSEQIRVLEKSCISDLKVLVFYCFCTVN